MGLLPAWMMVWILAQFLRLLPELLEEKMQFRWGQFLLPCHRRAIGNDSIQPFLRTRQGFQGEGE